MDDFATVMLHEAGLQDPDDNDDDAQLSSSSNAGTGDSAKTARSLRRGIFKAASLQDKLLEK